MGKISAAELITAYKPCSDIAIGIDPDLVASGVAIVANGSLMHLRNEPINDLVEFIHSAVVACSIAGNAVAVLMEDPEVNKPVFSHGTNNRRKRERIAQNVGNVKAAARLIAELLNANGIEVIKVAPLKGPVKQQAKKNGAYFNKLTGWIGKSNKDTRDAALIALYGRRSQ